MGYNPANFAYDIGTGPWTRGYSVSYAISFVDARTGRESPRSEWWGLSGRRALTGDLSAA
jgi:hypothetical protein